MEIIIRSLKISVALSLIQSAVIYMPYLLAKKRDRKTIQQLILFRPFDFLFSGIFLFVISLAASPFDNMAPDEHIFSYYMGNWIFVVIASSYFFIIYPYLLKIQPGKFIIAGDSQKKYSKIFNSNIPVYITSRKVFNAFATGFFPGNRTIIIGKSLAENLTEEERFAIICHEQGHHKANDLFKFFCFMSFALLCFIVGRVWFIHLIKQLFPTADKGLVIGIFAGLHCVIFYCVLFSKLSHKAEYNADIFAAKYAGAANTISALQTLNFLTNDVLVNDSITHPSLEKRIKNIRKNHV